MLRYAKGLRIWQYWNALESWIVLDLRKSFIKKRVILSEAPCEARREVEGPDTFPDSC